MAHVFISYSRRKQTFADDLDAALTARGTEGWVDHGEIPKGAEWQSELHEAIEKADALVFVITHESVVSTECRAELDHAKRNGKRIVTVLQDPVDPAALPEPAAAIQWVDFSDGRPFAECVDELVGTLATDLPWVKAHTDLQVLALDWDAHGRDPGRMLRGAKLRQAEEWQSAAAGKETAPTELQGEYILASRRGASRRQRLMITTAIVVAAVSVGLGLVALVQRNTARTQSAIATSRELAATALRVTAGDPELGLLLATKAVEKRRTAEARGALREALRRRPVLRAWPARDGPLGSVSLGPGRRLVVTAGSRGVIRLSDLVTGRTRVLARDPRASAAALSPDGRLVVTAGAGARLLPVAGGPARPLGPEAPVTAVAFAAGRPLAIAGEVGGTARVTDTRTGREIAVLDGRTQLGRHGLAPGTRLAIEQAKGRAVDPGERAVGDVALSPDGTLAATSFLNGTTYVWDVPDGRYVAKIAGTRAAFSPRGDLLATADVIRVGLWDLRTRRAVAPLTGPRYELTEIEFGAGGDRLLAAGGDGEARIFDVGARRQLTTLPHAGPITGAALSRDGELAATVDEKGVTRVWEAGSDGSSTLLSHDARSLAFLPRGRRVAVIADGQVRVSDDRVGEVLARLGPAPGDMTDLDTAPDGDRVATVGAGGRLGLWDASSGQALWSAREPAPSNAVRFRVDGRQLATAGQDGRARIWDVARGRRVAELAHAAPVVWARPAADGRHVFTFSEPDPHAALTLTIWHDGRPESRRDDPEPGAVTRDGRRLAYTTQSGLFVRDVGTSRTWELPLRARAGDGLQRRMTFSGDGRLLFAAGANDKTGRVWDVGARRALGRSPGTTPVEGAAFSRDGRLVAVARGKRTLEVWESASGRSVLSLPVPGVVSAQFSPAGDGLAILTGSGEARLVACDVCLPDSELLALARRRATRPLTGEERARYLHE